MKKNKEKIKEYAKGYRENNKDKIKEHYILVDKYTDMINQIQQ